MITNSISVLVAQTPQLINYQAIARNSNTGVELSDQAVFVSLKILKDGPNGNITYQEDHDNVATNRFGLFNLSIGDGIPVTGTFANIDWSNGGYWLQIDIDAGNGLETMSSMQFVSVPYALHAETVTNANDADADPENELVTAIEFNSNVFSLIQPGSTLTQDLSALINDADADPQNELVTSIEFNPENNVFSLVQPGSTLTRDLSALINDADSDPQNELVTDIGFNTANNTFILTQQGTELTQDLSALINDADSDPTNEAITSVTLSGTNLIINEVSDFTVSLSQLVNDADADPENEKISSLELVNDTIFRIHEGAEVYEIDFGTLKRDMDWRISDDGQTISNFGTQIGIGTPSPKSTLQINGSVGYKTTILSNLLGSITYNVTSTDNIIVCTMTPSAPNPVTINMPSANSCSGRSITIRKTGMLPIVAPVSISFGTDLLDFSNVDYNMNNFQRETVTFISLGVAGWTRVYTD